MSESFGNQVQFLKSGRLNESMMVFSSSLTVQDVVSMLRSINVIKETAELIKTSLKSIDFGLDDKFCDSEELIGYWVNTEPPTCLIQFFPSLLNVSQAALMKISNRDEEEYFEVDEDYNDDSPTVFTTPQVAKAIKIKSLYQIMYYIWHNGRKNTPLHVITGPSVYDRCKSREIITTLN